MAKYTFISMEKKGPCDHLMTLRKEGLFGKSKIKRFRGDCTVWNDVDEGYKRCGTILEGMLSEFWTGAIAEGLVT